MRPTREMILEEKDEETIDTWVAIYVMGWHRATSKMDKPGFTYSFIDDENGEDWVDSENRYARGYPNYDGYEDDEDLHLLHWHPSGSLLWSMEDVLDEFDRKEWDIAITSYTEDEGKVWGCSLDHYSVDNYIGSYGAGDESLPMAICKAALLAVIGKEDG